jgi:spore coat polysaccharide biosynthesis predicted glycosyltransferase SpsG
LKYPHVQQGQVHLNGPDYFIIKPNILKATKKNQKHSVRKRAKNLLVIMGGSIRAKLFERMVKVIGDLLDLDILVKFVVGYDFPGDISQYQNLFGNKVELVFGTDDLGELMTWADIALASSGYVKYELAAVGVPTILVSIEEHQDILGKAFAQKGNCAVFAGNIFKLEYFILRNMIKAIIEDYDKRCIFSKNGRKLVDGEALGRLCREVSLLANEPV